MRAPLTHLLYTARDERSVLCVHPLIDKTATVTCPWCFHLREYPLISSETPRVVEVDCMVQADHHANLWRLVLRDVLAILQPAYALDIYLVHELHAPQFGVIHSEESLKHILVDA